MVAVGAALSLDAWLLSSAHGGRGRLAALAALAMVAALFAFDVAMPPVSLGEEYARRQGLIAPYAADPCVYLVGSSYQEPADNNYSITSDVPQLMEFEDVHVEKDPASAGIAAYLASKGDPDEVVLYIDVYPHSSTLNGEETAAEVARSFGYHDRELIQSSEVAGYSSSETYLLRR